MPSPEEKRLGVLLPSQREKVPEGRMRDVTRRLRGAGWHKTLPYGEVSLCL